jgi:hypothetical protein
MTKDDRDKGVLSERQVKSIPHLVAAPNYEKGRRKAGISRNTLYEWLKDPAFTTELKSQRNQVIDGALDVLKGHVGGAVEALVGLLPTKNEYLRRTVANDIIEHVMKGKELDELEKRLKALENAIKSKRREKP